MVGWDCRTVVIVISVRVLVVLLLVRFLLVRYGWVGLSYYCCCYQYCGFVDVFIGEIGIFERGSIRRDCHVIIIISLWR